MPNPNGALTRGQGNGCNSTAVVSRDCLPATAVHRALMLTGAVHDEGPAAVAALLLPLDGNELRALTVALAAMVPTDYTAGELLAWNDVRYLDVAAPHIPVRDPRTGRPLAPHGTHAAFNRHRKAGEEPCAACWTGERTFQRERTRDRRARAHNVEEATG